MKKVALSITILIMVSCSSVQKIRQGDVVTKIIHYSGVPATSDTYFNNASSAIKYKNTILLTDTGNNLIRQIKDNKITTYVGNGKKENVNGRYTKASLNNPENIMMDRKKNIYVSVNFNQIQKIDSLGNVTHFAGKYSPGWIDGGVDGEREVASFKFISSLVRGRKEIIYVADGNKIRKISADGNVTTITGSNQSGDKTGKAEDALFYQISDIALNEQQDIYIVDQVNKKIKKLSEGLVTTFVPVGIINWPTSIAVNSKGQVFVFDDSTKILYMFNSNGKLINTLNKTILASQKYSFQVKMTVDDQDNIILPSVDFINMISPDFQITQIGEKNGSCRNGTIDKATFNIPYDGVFDTTGNLYAIEKGNYDIRKISKEGFVSTFSGNGEYGDKTGSAQNTSFINMVAIAMDSYGNLYVIDGDWKDVRIKKIDANGESSIFIDPKKENLENERWNDLVFDSENNLYVSDNVKNVIYKFDSLGNRIQFDLGIRLNAPAGLAIDKNDNLFICDSNNNRILKVSRSKKTTLIIPKGIRLDEPEHITIDNSGNLYVTDKNRTRIVKIDSNLKSEIFLAESTLGKNKTHNFSEYTNTLKIESFGDAIYVFDKYDNQIFKLK